MISKNRAFRMLTLGVSLTALMCGGLALFESGLVADENNLTMNASPTLWIIFGIGVVGFLIALPAWLSSRLNKLRQSNT